MSDRPSVGPDDLDECWCCGGLHDSFGGLCPNCAEAGCNRFTDGCDSDHKPVMPDGGRPGVDADRRCTNCGKSVEDLPYEFWLFSTCRSCASEPAPKRWGTSKPYVGTGRKWLYWPRWHYVEARDGDSHWRTEEMTA